LLLKPGFLVGFDRISVLETLEQVCTKLRICDRGDGTPPLSPLAARRKNTVHLRSLKGWTKATHRYYQAEAQLHHSTALYNT
jgi:hypothetical protein